MNEKYVKIIQICIYLAISLSLGQMPFLSQIPAPPPHPWQKIWLNALL